MKHLKLLLRSLLKNDACIEGGRNYSWWVALIFFILSTIISVIPITVSLFTVDAGTVISSGTFESDKGLHFALNSMKEEGVDIQFHNANTEADYNDKLDAEGKTFIPYITLTSEKADIPNYDSVNSTYFKQITGTVYYSYTVTTKDENGKDVTETKTATIEDHPILRIYVFANAEKEELQNKLNLILQGKDAFNPLLEPETDKDKILNKNDISFILFGKHSFAFYKYNSVRFNGAVDTPASVSPAGVLTGTYRDIKVKNITELSGATLTDTVTKAADFFRDGYNELKLSNAGIQISIYLAINAGIVIIMGFILWLLTRGKNNPFKFYKIIDCFKISGWTSFTPAIIALILGFIMGASNGLGGFAFILVFGLRSMWLAMKNLRPQPNAK